MCVHRIYSSTPVQNQFCTYFFLQSNAIRVWATIEDDDEVVKAMREDAAEEMAAALAGTLSLSDPEEEAEGEEEEKEDGGDEIPERPTGLR